MTDSNWSRDYFERGYAQRWGLSAPSDRVRSEGSSLCNLLRLEASDRLIDIGCGHGRHAVVLAERGLEVTGVDTSPALLARAQQLAAELRSHVRLVRGDMRQLPIHAGSADAAIVMDAFGFFETDDEHQSVLREAARVLTTGGRVGMKVLNGSHVVGAFHETDAAESEGTLISISRTLSVDPFRITERIAFSGSGGAGEYERRQRLYSAHELRAALEDAGFVNVAVYGGPDGTPFDPALASTIWIVGQRP